MKYITLESLDVKISAISLGCWQFGDPNWGWGSELNEEKAIKIIQEAFNLGVISLILQRFMAKELQNKY